MSTRRCVAALIFLALAHPATAELTAQQAVAQVKASSKTQLSTFKSTGKTALATLDAALKPLESQLSSDTAPADFGDAVADLSITFIETMNNAFLNALDDTSNAAASALQELADGADLAGVYPEPLYVGTGGVLDAHRKAVVKAANKLRDAAVKRLAKTAALAEKGAGLALTVRLELPTAADAASINQEGALSLDEDARIDVVLAVSALDAAEDGFLAVAGTTHDTLDLVTVGYHRTFEETDSVDVTALSVTGRYKGTFTGLLEGGYVVFAQQLAGPLDAVAAIGLR